MAKAWVAVNRVYKIDDHTVLIRTDAVDSVDEENGRSCRSNFLEQLNDIGMRQAQARRKCAPSRAANPVVLQEKDRPRC